MVIVSDFNCGAAAGVGRAGVAVAECGEIIHHRTLAALDAGILQPAEDVPVRRHMAAVPANHLNYRGQPCRHTLACLCERESSGGRGRCGRCGRALRRGQTGGGRGHRLLGKKGAAVCSDTPRGIARVVGRWLLCDAELLGEKKEIRPVTRRGDLRTLRPKGSRETGERLLSVVGKSVGGVRR